MWQLSHMHLDTCHRQGVSAARLMTGLAGLHCVAAVARTTGMACSLESLCLLRGASDQAHIDAVSGAHANELGWLTLMTMSWALSCRRCSSRVMALRTSASASTPGTPTMSMFLHRPCQRYVTACALIHVCVDMHCTKGLLARYVCPDRPCRSGHAHAESCPQGARRAIRTHLVVDYLVTNHQENLLAC